MTSLNVDLVAGHISYDAETTRNSCVYIYLSKLNFFQNKVIYATPYSFSARINDDANSGGFSTGIGTTNIIIVTSFVNNDTINIFCNWCLLVLNSTMTVNRHIAMVIFIVTVSSGRPKNLLRSWWKSTLVYKPRNAINAFLAGLDTLHEKLNRLYKMCTVCIGSVYMKYMKRKLDENVIHRNYVYLSFISCKMNHYKTFNLVKPLILVVIGHCFM